MGPVRAVDPVIWLALACGTECDPACHLERAKALLVTDPAAAIAEVRQIDDATERDLALLELAAADPTRGGLVCAEITTPYGKEKCAQVVGRPHLGGR